MKLERIIPLLRCPKSGTPLKRLDATSIRSEAGHVYPIVRGKPVLVRILEAHHTEPPAAEIISQNTPSFFVPDSLPADAVVLHLGCGEVGSDDDRVISTDILPTSAADIVAEAENLPILTGSIDDLVSGAVFEHVHDPRRSASEVRRVLRDGGTFYIDTAFLQGYHGYPSHFFNMTPQAVETVVVDDFILDASCVGPIATCAHVFLEIQHRMLSAMDPADARTLLDMPLREVVEIFRRDETRTNPYLAKLPEYVHRSLAASFVVIGRKPNGYDDRDVGLRESYAHSRRAYYAARMGLIQSHGEVSFYRRRCELLGMAVDPLAGLDALLVSCLVADTGSGASFDAATVKLRDLSGELTLDRDRYIRLL